MVTYDGHYRPWLIEHQPHISIEQVNEWKSKGRSLKFLTGWVPAKAFIELADELYFLDAEIKYTCGEHFKPLKKLLKTKIRRVSTHSRTQQAWYMATFGLDVALIPIWSDEVYWFPDSSRRHDGLVGYMLESERTIEQIEIIKDYCGEAGVRTDFLRISGTELQVLEAMQRCDIFLGMNPGKHPLWGEGCPYHSRKRCMLDVFRSLMMFLETGNTWSMVIMDSSPKETMLEGWRPIWSG